MPPPSARPFLTLMIVPTPNGGATSHFALAPGLSGANLGATLAAAKATIDATLESISQTDLVAHTTCLETLRYVNQRVTKVEHLPPDDLPPDPTPT